MRPGPDSSQQSDGPGQSPAGGTEDPGWRPLAVLGVAQFLMVLDTAVMNVSVTQLVEDFDTQVSTIQAVITLYSLVMAAFMVTGGKLGDRLGRRRAFRLGLIVYGVGSTVTATAGSVTVLAGGWSILEGLGAALVLPALAALVAGTYSGPRRAIAYGVLGGVAGAGVAVGPILGGYFTTDLSWRWVFVIEALMVVGLVAASRWLVEPAPGRSERIDAVGVALSAAGIGLVVFGVLQSGSWGWMEPRNSPIEPFGFSLTPFMISAGIAALWGFRRWHDIVVERGGDPLVQLALLSNPTLRSGLSMLLLQNLILLGIFFTIPLYLQLTQDLDAFETGVRLLPASVTMLVFALAGSALSRVAGPRTIVRTGLAMLAGASLMLCATIRPELEDLSFAASVGVLGVGMGLLASQLGNVVQSSVSERDRGAVGGLQFTAGNVGSAFGTAFVGAVLIGALTTAFVNNVASDPAIAPFLEDEAVQVQLHAGVPFVSSGEVESALAESGLSEEQQEAIVASYEDAQLQGLRIAVLVTAAIALAGFVFTRHLPRRTRWSEPAEH